MTVPLQRSRPVRPASPPYPEDPTTATRHMCAGAYLDDEFRNVSLREVYNRPRRMVAPSYGFDLVPVLGHCLRVRNAAVVRDAVIVLTVLTSVCVAGSALVTAIALLIVVYLVASTYRLVQATYRKKRSSDAEGSQNLLLRALFLMVAWSVLIYVPIAVAVALAGSSDYGGDGSAEEALTQVLSIYGTLALTALLFGGQVGFALWRQLELGKLRPGATVASPVRTPRLDDIARQQRGNTVAYSGFHPFVGSGFLQDTWSFAVRLVRPAPGVLEKLLNGDGGESRHAAPAALSESHREFEAPPFDAQEVIDHVRADLIRLIPAPGNEAEERIPGLSVEDRVFLAGTEVSHLVPYTDPQVMAAVIRHPTTPARHYLTCQVFSWGGELMTTVYVHIAVQGRSLYIELCSAVLPPCNDDYRIVDTVENIGSAAWLRAIRRGLVDAPMTVWRSPVSLFRGVADLVRTASGGQAGPARMTRGFDYGATIGIRELACREEGMRNLVQSLDYEKYHTLIERRVIAAVLDFLDDRDIDTTEYRSRAASILNVNGSVGSIGSGNTMYGSVTGTSNGGQS